MEKQTSLSGEALLTLLQNKFKLVPDFRSTITPTYPLADVLMAGFSIFALKIPSLLQLEKIRTGEQKMQSNLAGMFRLQDIPSDTRMREILDEVDPSDLRPTFTNLFDRFAKSGLLKEFRFIDNKYLLSIDGTEHFSSDRIHCGSCMTRVNKVQNSVSYYHQMLAGSIVCPGKRTVIPLCPEPIIMQNKERTKNDSEQNAFRRFLTKFRQEHPRLPVIILADALHSHGPNLRDFKKFEVDYLMSAKPGSHQRLFEALNKWEKRGKVEHLTVKEVLGKKIIKDVTHEFRFANDILFNHSHLDISTNAIDYVETTEWISPKGEMKKTVKKFTWVTSLEVTKDNVYQLMRGGRSRWKIENETFNTLKNQGYEFEHNYGHGYKYLSTVMAYLMMLAFLWDQLQEIGCALYKKALARRHSQRIRLWECMKGGFLMVKGINSWTNFLRLVADELEAPLINTS